MVNTGEVITGELLDGRDPSFRYIQSLMVRQAVETWVQPPWLLLDRQQCDT
jgi:hypothetical protein